MIHEAINSIEKTLKLFDLLKNSVLISLVLSISLAILTFKETLKFTDVPLEPYVFFSLYLFLTFSFFLILIRLGIFIFKKIVKENELHKHISLCKKHLRLLEQEPVGQAAILIVNKHENKKVFIAEDNDHAQSLSNKDLLIQRRWIRNRIYEWEIPTYVWNSKELKDLITKYPYEEAHKIIARK